MKKQWKDPKATTLERTIIKLVLEKRTDSVQFQRLLAFFGRDKIEKIYKDWRARGCIFQDDLPLTNEKSSRSDHD